MSDTKEFAKFQQEFVRAWKAREPSSSMLPLVCDRIRSEPEGPYGSFLAKLTSRYPDACNAAANFASDPSPSLRKAAIHCVYEATPRDVIQLVLNKLIADSDESISEGASLRAAHLHVRGLAGEIESRAISILDSERANGMKEAAELLRVGYVVQYDVGDYLGVRMLYRGGIVRFPIEKIEVQEVGLPVAVKRRWNWVVR